MRPLRKYWQSSGTSPAVQYQQKKIGSIDGLSIGISPPILARKVTQTGRGDNQPITCFCLLY